MQAPRTLNEVPADGGSWNSQFLKCPAAESWLGCSGDSSRSSRFETKKLFDGREFNGHRTRMINPRPALVRQICCSFQNEIRIIPGCCQMSIFAATESAG